MRDRPKRNKELILSALLIAVSGLLLSTIACAAGGARSRSNVSVIGGDSEPSLLTRYLLQKKEREKGIPTESEWNRLGLWRKISTSPVLYVPQGFFGKIPTSNSNGTWFKDERDGKKLFVPSEQVGEYSPALLRGDAEKVTTWIYE